MTTRALVMMVFVLGSMWGGFACLLLRAMRKNSNAR